MAHAHEHHHDSTYYLDQLCTIASCGALGAVAILMYGLKGPDGKSKLEYILAPQFFIPVLIGGIALLMLIAVRAITLWQEAGRAKNCAGHEHHHHDHAHEHAHDHGHDHDHGHHHHGHDHDHAHAHDHHHDHAHDHGHDHGHEHGWTPVRYAVLMLPIVLYFLNLPNSSFSADWAERSINREAFEGTSGLIEDRGKIDLGFKELSKAAHYPNSRQELEGKTGRLKGMFLPLSNDKEFTLIRVKINCCAADAIPLEVRIVSQENITRFKSKEWVEVEGQIQFRKLVGREKYIPVLMLKSADQVKPTPPLPDYAID